MAYFDFSPAKLLKEIYPDHEWLPWRFNAVSKRYWINKENQREYMKWLCNRLGFVNMEDLYRLTYDHFRFNDGTPSFRFGANPKHSLLHAGSRLICLYRGSPSELVLALYPEHNWEPWKFSVAPRGWWDKFENQKRYMDWLKERLNYSKMSDLYHLTSEIISKEGGTTVFALIILISF